jgi:glycosyltransferase involved in cell wall biosynthesis
MISIIIPAKNESSGLAELLPWLKQNYSKGEIIVVNDGSADNTIEICQNNDVKVINHPYSKGNGAAIKTGANAAKGDVLVFMDADGQHRPQDIKLLLDKFSEGYHMVVGARDSKSQASVARWGANKIYNMLASWMVNRKIADLTSGFRIANATKFREFLYLLPNGFSYPTTITMAFFRAGYSVGYVPINMANRSQNTASHISLIKDGIRFFLIIFKVGTLYSPLKIFLPLSLFHFLAAIGFYAYTFFTAGRFTNMSVLLFTTSILIFLIGLISEQITMLLYQKKR